MPKEYDPSVKRKSIDQVSTLKQFLKRCQYLIKYESALNVLRHLIEKCVQEKKAPTTQCIVNHVRQRIRMNHEFMLDVCIGGYDTKETILDLGSDFNVMPRRT